MIKKKLKLKREVLPIAEAFTRYYNGEKYTKPKFIDLNLIESLPNNSQIGFKFYKQYKHYTLEVIYDGITLILPKVTLEMSHTSTVSSESVTDEVQPILIGEDSYMDFPPALVIQFFGTLITLDRNFVAEKISNTVYKILHVRYPKTYVHPIKCDFTKVITDSAAQYRTPLQKSWGDHNFHAADYPNKPKLPTGY
jgi:hypothetical protein